MGFRKKMNAIIAKERKASKIKRDAKKLKRLNAEPTPGQKLHAIMHGKVEN